MMKTFDLSKLAGNFKNKQHFYTDELDSFDGDYDISIINKIILWKLGRGIDYDRNEDVIIDQINTLKDAKKHIDAEECLRLLLKLKGVRLPMASSILRFRNPAVFQIIDQRLHRVVYDKGDRKAYNREFKEYQRILSGKSERKITQQCELYFRYLDDLIQLCNEHNIQFSKSDRILFQYDLALGNKLRK